MLRGKEGTDDYTAYALVGDPVVLTASTTAKIQWTRAGDPKPQCMTVEVGKSNRMVALSWRALGHATFTTMLRLTWQHD